MATSSDEAVKPVPLVLLPGTMCDDALFRPMLEELRPARPVIIGDMTGGASAELLATAMLASLPSRFALAGFSLGGIVAIEIAARASDRVAGVALIASTARPVPPDDQARRRAEIAAVREGASYVEGRWSAHVAAHRSDDHALGEAIVGMAMRADLATLRSQSEVALTRPDNRSRLPGLAMPVLVLGGGADPINPPSVQREAASLLPDATLTLVPEAGHFLPLEAPGATAAALKAWLERVDARGWAPSLSAVSLPNRPRTAAGRP